MAYQGELREHRERNKIKDIVTPKSKRVEKAEPEPNVAPEPKVGPRAASGRQITSEDRPKVTEMSQEGRVTLSETIVKQLKKQVVVLPVDHAISALFAYQTAVINK